MPRQAHGRSVLQGGTSKPKIRKTVRGKALNVLETAEAQFPSDYKVPQHRLGYTSDDDEKPQTRADVDDRSNKRRKIEGTEQNEDSEAEGSDVDGQEFHVGMDDEDEDSDIDSDEAFGASDEERFADFTFRGSESNTTAKGRGTTRLDLDEDAGSGSAEDDEDDDSLGDEAVDLTAAWDMDDADEQAEKSNKKDSRQRQASPDSSEQSMESDGDDESEDIDDKMSGISVSDDEVDEQTTARLKTFVDALIPAQQDAQTRRSHRQSKDLADRPSQFGLGSAGLTAADLMQYIKDPIQRQSLKIIQQAEKEELGGGKGGIPGKLAAPLAKRQQDRLDRVAAYDKTKEQMGRWVDTIKQNRRAEHISFPGIDVAKASAANLTHLQPLSNNEPQTELEQKIAKIMQDSGMVSEKKRDEEGREAEYEQLAEKNIPVEEIQARHRQLRMQRELMFREEIRARRIKKIKSKAYRRVHRKERDRQEVQQHERLLAAGIINSDEEREEHERKRAETRMGARHKESKWAKAAKASGQMTWNEDAKNGATELARRDEELRRRVEGKNVNDGEDQESTEDNTDEDSEVEGFRLREKVDALQDIDAAETGTRLGNMPFMRKAEADRRAQNDQQLRQLRNDLNGEHDSDNDDASEEESTARLSFGKRSKPVRAPIASTKLTEFEERLSDEEQDQSETEQSTTLTINPQASNSPKPTNTQLPHAVQTSTQASRSDSVKITRPTQTKARKSAQATKSNLEPDYTSPSSSEDELDARDRLALDIFAGDEPEDLTKQFIREKRTLTRTEDDQTASTALPGWGTWTGHGVSKPKAAKTKMIIKKGTPANLRADAALDRVIISEKQIKKNSAYLASDLPFPYESRAQYERALRVPVGPEWNTRRHFQDGIKPRVLLKQGVVVKPVSRPLS